MSASHLLPLARSNPPADSQGPQKTAMQSSNAALHLCQPHHETMSVCQQDNLKTLVNDDTILSQVDSDNCRGGFLVTPDKLKRIQQPAPPCPFYSDKIKSQQQQSPSPCSTIIKCTPPPPIIKKNVQFDESRNECYHNTQLYKEDLKEHWYTTRDNEDFKDAANSFLRDVILEDKRNKARYAFRKVVLRAYDACCESVYETDTSLLTQDEEFYLKKWFSIASNLVGVERWAVRQIREDVKNRKSLLLERVVAIQKMGRLVAMGDDNDDDVRNEFLVTQAEFLKKSCEAISRPSRLFARHIGAAQAASIIQNAAA